jgi:polar amino acid transport system substrate-binding protein
MGALLTAALLLSLPPSGQATEPVKVATGEWPPYTSSRMAHCGVAAEIVSRVFQRMGVEVDFVFYPWARCYESVKQGTVWGAFPYGRTDERAAEVRFSDSMIRSTLKLFYFDKDAADFQFETLADLKPYRIGSVRGYYQESVLKKAGLTLDFAPEPRNGFEKLLLGRTDLFAANELAGWFLLNRTFPEKVDRFGTLQKPLDRHGLRMIASRRYPGAESLLQRFNAALAEVKNEMFYRAILEKLRNRRPDDGR